MTDRLDPAVVRDLGIVSGFAWTLEESAAIRDQLVSIATGLRAAAERIDAVDTEPATAFRPRAEA